MRSFAITNPPSIRRLDPRLLLIVGVGLMLGLPCLLYGFPFYGDDSVTQAVSYSRFAEQLWQGDLYPRWLPKMNGGLGSTYFFYYSPVPHYLTSILKVVFRGDEYGWHQLGIGAVVALIASGLSLYVWLKPHSGVWPAVVAALIYIALPYHLNIDLYSRGAYAELWTFVWMPLVLVSIDRVIERRKFAWLGLSLSYSLLVMTHLPTTLIFSPVAMAYSFFQAQTGQRPRVFGVTLGGMLLGVGLSAIYLIPALALQRFSFLSEGTIGHYHYANWFLLTTLNWSSHRSDLFWFTFEVAALTSLAFVVTRFFGDGRFTRQATFWFLIGLVSFWMMSPLSKPVWSTFTTLQKVQFPWRFNTILSLAAAALTALSLASVGRWSVPAVVLKVALMLLLGIWIYDAGRRAWDAYPVHYVDQAVVNFRNKWLEQSRDQNEYRPRWVVSIKEKDLEALLRRIGKTPSVAGAAEFSPAGIVSIRSWTSKEIALEVDSPEGGVLSVSQFYFPGWRAQMDGAKGLEVSPTIPGGLASMRVPGGKHRISLERGRTAPESAGLIISAIAATLLVLLTVSARFFQSSGSKRRVAKMASDNNHPSRLDGKRVSMTKREDLIDVRSLLARSSPDELNQLAEDYFARLTNWDYHLAKPFGAVDETPQLLINFAVILQGLKICPGMTIMEFGAGTCWASRFLSQLGCHVIATDVSETALRIGAELYARQPPFGNTPEPRFLPFDGRRFELPAESVDRVMCLDAFHHVPDPGQILAELARVLKPGGIAGFAEPGPDHSKSAQSQYEMRTFGVVENDVDIHSIWQAAKRVGFTKMKLALFNIPPVQLELQEFDNFLTGGKSAARRWSETTRRFMESQRNFFLFKGESAISDSRFRSGLVAEIHLSPTTLVVNEESIPLRAHVRNTSNSVWLPLSAGLGAVLLGCHVYDNNGKVFRHSYHWEALTPGEGRPILPGESIECEVNIPALPKGSYVLEFDMVSKDVCWFALNGSPQARVELEVK